MLPILISAAIQPAMIGKILIMKCIAGVICGYLVDLVYKRHPKMKEANHIHDFCEQEHCDCDHENNIILSALKHTINIVILIFGVSVVLNIFFEYTENTAYAAALWNHPVWGAYSVWLDRSDSQLFCICPDYQSVCTGE